METRKLFYEDCLMAEFTAVVLACRESEKGWLVELDQTAFYPEGGGQPCDLGRLGTVRVLDVREKDGEILHLCDGTLEVGAQVTGAIDWQRRLDLMQQHTGEHIVSGIINRRYGYHNVGFHMGADVVTIDFDGMIPQEDLAEIEGEANRAVWENLAVNCWYPSPEELPNVTYRTKKALPWPVRIVQVPGYDSCACCGVHVKQTGQVGLVKLFSCVKFHQGVRIEMACGGKALTLLSKVYEQNRQVSQAFSAKVLETGEAARRMNEALAAEKFRAAGLEKQVFAGVAENYRDKGNVLHFGEGFAPGSVRDLADAIASVCGGIAGVLSGKDGDYSLCFVSRTDDLKTLGQVFREQLNARGGGKPGFFQGSVQADRNAIETTFAEL